MSAAAELRTAASKLRELAEGATSGPWLAEEDSWAGWRVILPPDGLPGVAVVASDIHQGEDDGECDSHYIAAMNPLIGRVLADLLDSLADDAEQSIDDHAAYGAPPRDELVLARLINGGGA